MAPSAAVSTNPPETTQPRPPIATAAMREAVGLLLLLVGLAAVLVAAYRTDVNLGIALTGGLLVGAGALLTTRRRT